MNMDKEKFQHWIVRQYGFNYLISLGKHVNDYIRMLDSLPYPNLTLVYSMNLRYGKANINNLYIKYINEVFYDKRRTSRK